MDNIENGRFYQIVQSDRTADIYIFGDITRWPYAAGDKSAGGLVREIQGLDVDVINIHINSYGGSVSEGWAMYNTLREHKAQIHTYADGFVASAALYPFLAGDRRTASSLSAFYLHEVQSGACGSAANLRAAADDADMMTDIGIQAFVERAGMTEAKVRELMQAETWLRPGEALELGIVTEMYRSGNSGPYTQSAQAAVFRQIFGAPPSCPSPTKSTNLFAAMAKNERSLKREK